jgi:hypothetical protein
MVDDELWALIAPVLPAWPERSPGPRPVEDRLCLQGVLFVLFTGITWQQLPPELGFGSGQTCWRRLCRWTEARTAVVRPSMSGDGASREDRNRPNCSSSVQYETAVRWEVHLRDWTAKAAARERRMGSGTGRAAKSNSLG